MIAGSFKKLRRGEYFLINFQFRTDSIKEMVVNCLVNYN
jgi:ribosomal protein S6